MIFGFVVIGFELESERPIPPRPFFGGIKPTKALRLKSAKIDEP